MTEQDKFNSEVDKRLSNLETKFEMFIDESRQQREDIRRLQERQDAMQTRIDSKFDSLMNQIHNLTIAAVVGFGVITVAMAGVIFTALK